MHKQVQMQVEVGGGPKPRTKDVLWRGHKIRLYSIGWLSYLTYLAVVTLRVWEHKEILPKPFFKLSGNTRWFTPAELMIYAKRVQVHYQSGRDLMVLKKQLSEAHVAIRKEYMGLKEKEKVKLELLALPNEKIVSDTFKQKDNLRHLSKNHYHEVSELIKQK